MDSSTLDTIYTSAKAIVPALLDILAGHGVREAVCSPGSRNIPLLLGLKGSDTIHYRMVTDERSAAFIAFGLSVSTNAPVMLVCTSGTAMLNYAPAVAEAFYQGRPLIVVSADRPQEWIDQDDSQTIKQFGALHNIVKMSYDISDTDIDRKDGRWYAERVFNDAMLVATSEKQGPVHINLRLTPPLDATLPIEESVKARVIRRISPVTEPNRNVIKEMARQAMNSKVLLVAGFMLPDARINKAVNNLRRHSNVVVMAETISNLHLPAEDYAIDSLLCSHSPGRPDLVISIGGALVSRMLKEYLRNIPDKENLTHWSIGYNHTTVDCFQSLTATVECDPALFISRLSAEMAHLKKIGETVCDNDTNSYSENVNNFRRVTIKRMDVETEASGWSEASAIKYILQHIPSADNLCISNGTAIRYVQILTRSLHHAQYCNRGVSGIDGSTSTAVGTALGYKGHTWLLTGDMSFNYDLSGLAEASRLDTGLKIIVINNQGGGIFRFISSARDLDIREEMLCVDRHADIAALANAFGYKYCKATDMKSLANEMNNLHTYTGRALLEVSVDGAESAAILRRLLKSK